MIINLIFFMSMSFFLHAYGYIIRPVNISDAKSVVDTYRLVAQSSKNLALLPDEITYEYVHALILEVTQNGLGFVAEDQGKIIGWMFKQRYSVYTLSHILHGGNISVHPNYQGQGIGSRIIQKFLQEVQQNYPDILRVELYVLESNPAVLLYQRLGFEIEALLKQSKINTDGSLESYYVMTWFNPNYAYVNNS